jgi:hypothetical protein
MRGERQGMREAAGDEISLRRIRRTGQLTALHMREAIMIANCEAHQKDCTVRMIKEKE